MTYWKRLDRKVHYSSDWLSMTLDKIELPDGRTIENFELMHFPHESVGLVALNEVGDILLVRAYRYLHESFQWEIPGGLVEKEEHPMDACRRELQEETGYTVGILTPLLSFYPHKATCDQKYHLYLGENLEKTGSDVQKVEITEVAFHSPGAVRQMIDSGEIDDGLSLVALHRYLLMKKR